MIFSEKLYFVDGKRNQENQEKKRDFSNLILYAYFSRLLLFHVSCSMFTCADFNGIRKGNGKNETPHACKSYKYMRKIPSFST